MEGTETVVDELRRNVYKKRPLVALSYYPDQWRKIKDVGKPKPVIWRWLAEHGLVEVGTFGLKITDEGMDIVFKYFRKHNH